MVVHFVTGLVSSPLFEEPGWRGFALPRLQQRLGRELGSLAVGTLWWLWHQPSNLTFGIRPTLYGYLSMVAFSFLIDSLFNLSGGNLLTAMLAHRSASTVFDWLYESPGHPFLPGLMFVVVMMLRIRESRSERSRTFPPAPPRRLTGGELRDMMN